LCLNILKCFGDKISTSLVFGEKMKKTKLKNGAFNIVQTFEVEDNDGHYSNNACIQVSFFVKAMNVKVKIFLIFQKCVLFHKV